MSRISRLVVLMTSVASLLGVTAGTAGAITWDVSGAGSFHATAPSPTFSVTGSSFSCPAATVTGSYAAGSFAGALYSGVTGSITIGGCLIVGQSMEISCAYKLTGATQPTTTTVTTGNVDLTCGMTLSSGAELCHISGAAHAVYTDNAVAADTLALTTTTAVTIGGTSCLFGNNDVTHMSAWTISVTSAGGGPHIHRTA